MPEKTIIKSINYSQEEIINDILSLHTDGEIDLDPTYSKGNFYKNGVVPEPHYKFDINPVRPGVIKASADNLPLEDSTMNCIMFDPPFLATKGKSLKSDKGNIINKRFGVFETEILLHEFYIRCLAEFYRLLKNKSILIFKCQDKVSSQKQYFSHTFIQMEAEKIGFYAKDLFILLAKNRIVADWQKKNQQHARKFHSYFWVFKKSNRKIKYVGR